MSTDPIPATPSAGLWSKYTHVLSVGIQNTLVYRTNFLFRAAFGLVPLAATLFLWEAIYADKPTGTAIGAYTLAQMVSYYLLVTVVDAFTAVAEDDWQIAADIKDGAVSQFLLKPLDFLAYRLCLYLSGRVIYTSAALIPVAVFLFFQRENLVGPAEPWGWILAPLSVLMAGLLQFLIAYTVALLSFWVLDVSTFIFIQFAFEFLASGHLFPLDILPDGLHRLLLWSPYPYLLYFPVGVYLGRIQGADLWQGFALQSAWVAAAFLIARFVWSRGLRKYTAVGG
ncbi:MAG: ABC-2 family transporter protein [Verrucomicrobia bacterium]|nr:ABC-2 family transporter protein [Verrucomicrobiota bacterium]